MRETVGPLWPSATPPAAEPARVLSWHLHDLADLARVRAAVREYAAVLAGRDGDDLRDQLVLALDEMASNALRHGGSPVVAAVHLTEQGFLVDVSDEAPAAPPTPAVDRDPSQGGLGLYLVAELATRHGWYVESGAKHVWALLPRR